MCIVGSLAIFKGEKGSCPPPPPPEFEIKQDFLYLKILDLSQLYVADGPMKKRIDWVGKIAHALEG